MMTESVIVGRAEVGVNFDRSELAYEDSPPAARLRGLLGAGPATVLRQFRVCGGSSRQAPADEWEQRARGEPQKMRTRHSRLRQAPKTGVT